MCSFPIGQRSQAAWINKAAFTSRPRLAAVRLASASLRDQVHRFGTSPCAGASQLLKKLKLRFQADIFNASTERTSGTWMSIGECVLRYPDRFGTGT